MRTLVIFLFLAATATAQYAPNYPRVLLPLENAICRVTTVDRDGSRSHGSGVLIRGINGRESNDYVLTAYHVLRDRRQNVPVQVTWDGAKEYDAQFCAARPGCDAALLLCENVPSEIPRATIADREICQGELCYAFGFGSAMTNRLECSGGVVCEFSSNMYGDPVWFSLAGSFRQGDSGGPVFVVRDGKPTVIGAGWGSVWDGQRGHHIITASRLRVLHRLFGLEIAKTNPERGGNGAAMLVTGGS